MRDVLKENIMRTVYQHVDVVQTLSSSHRKILRVRTLSVTVEDRESFKRIYNLLLHKILKVGK